MQRRHRPASTASNSTLLSSCLPCGVWMQLTCRYCIRHTILPTLGVAALVSGRPTLLSADMMGMQPPRSYHPAIIAIDRDLFPSGDGYLYAYQLLLIRYLREGQ